MPTTIDVLSAEPIMTVTIHGYVTAEEIEEINDISVEFLEYCEDHLYRITDVRNADLSCEDMMHILFSSRKYLSSGINPGVTLVFVGQNSWSQLAQDILSKEHFGIEEVPTFDTLEGAFAFVRSKKMLLEPAL